MMAKNTRNPIPEGAFETTAKVNMQGLALAWFNKSDWQRWLEIDTEFQPNYNHWLARCEAAIEQLRERGQIVEKVLIDPDAFLKWSAINGGKVDSGARAAYATFLLIERTSSTHH